MATHPDLGTAERAFQQSIENANSNKQWLDKNFDAIQTWLNKVTTKSNKKQAKNVRLPRTVVPSLYEIEIKPDMYGDVPENFKFYGSVKIHLYCNTETANITLHKNKIRVNQSTISVISEGSVGVASLYSRYSEDTDRQFMIVHLKPSLVAGQRYVLEMQYEGDLEDDLAGVYRSSYERNGKPVYVSNM